MTATLQLHYAGAIVISLRKPYVYTDYWKEGNNMVLTDCRILLVDDEKHILEINERLLSDNGFNNILCALNGREAASFTRWYLNDYHAYTWTRDDGILVVGHP